MLKPGDLLYQHYVYSVPLLFGIVLDITKNSFENIMYITLFSCGVIKRFAFANDLVTGSLMIQTSDCKISSLRQTTLIEIIKS